jgi:phosphatidylglycerophosphate synthase
LPDKNKVKKLIFVMFDKSVQAVLKPAFNLAAKFAIKAGLSANAVSVIGFVIGIAAAAAIAKQSYALGAVLILLSRIFDGIDGTVARLTQTSDQGGFLDISLDFLFYAAIPLSFAFANPAINALPAATLLAAFIGTGSTFLAFAAFAEKRGMHSSNLPDKSFYFLGGLTEATETIAVFVAMCVWPQHFAWLAYGFAALCCITIVTRIYWGYKAFQ